jgi:hypothetical protein
MLRCDELTYLTKMQLKSLLEKSDGQISMDSDLNEVMRGRPMHDFNRECVRATLALKEDMEEYQRDFDQLQWAQQSVHPEIQDRAKMEFGQKLHRMGEESQIRQALIETTLKRIEETPRLVESILAKEVEIPEVPQLDQVRHYRSHMTNQKKLADAIIQPELDLSETYLEVDAFRMWFFVRTKTRTGVRTWEIIDPRSTEIKSRNLFFMVMQTTQGVQIPQDFWLSPYSPMKKWDLSGLCNQGLEQHKKYTFQVHRSRSTLAYGFEDLYDQCAKKLGTGFVLITFPARCLACRFIHCKKNQKAQMRHYLNWKMADQHYCVQIWAVQASTDNRKVVRRSMLGIDNQEFLMHWMSNLVVSSLEAGMVVQKAVSKLTPGELLDPGPLRIVEHDYYRIFAGQRIITTVVTRQMTLLKARMFGYDLKLDLLVGDRQDVVVRFEKSRNLDESEMLIFKELRSKQENIFVNFVIAKLLMSGAVSRLQVTDPTVQLAGIVLMQDRGFYCAKLSVYTHKRYQFQGRGLTIPVAVYDLVSNVCLGNVSALDDDVGRLVAAVTGEIWVNFTYPKLDVASRGVRMDLDSQVVKFDAVENQEVTIKRSLTWEAPEILNVVEVDQHKLGDWTWETPEQVDWTSLVL